MSLDKLVMMILTEQYNSRIHDKGGMMEDKLNTIDECIQEAERLLTWLYEQRREIVNYLDLNKIKDTQVHSNHDIHQN